MRQIHHTLIAQRDDGQDPVRKRQRAAFPHRSQETDGSALQDQQVVEVLTGI